MEENRVGKVAYIRYEGGILGERHVDKHLDEPLAVRIGAGRVVKGIDDALRTMEVGETPLSSSLPKKAMETPTPSKSSGIPAQSFRMGTKSRKTR